MIAFVIMTFFMIGSFCYERIFGMTYSIMAVFKMAYFIMAFFKMVFFKMAFFRHIMDSNLQSVLR